MGWTGQHATHFNNKGAIDRKAEMHYRMFDNWPGHICLSESMVGSTYYAAVKEEDSGEVFALVCLTEVDNKDYFNFIHKDMDETCGPTQYKCPKKILKLLTPTENEAANNWRRLCWGYHNSQSCSSSFNKLPLGTEIEWTVPHDNFEGIKKGDVYKLTKQKVNPWKKRSHYCWVCRHYSGLCFRVRPAWVKEEDYRIISFGGKVT